MMRLLSSRKQCDRSSPWCYYLQFKEQTEFAYKHVNEPSSSMKDREFRQMSDYQLLKKDSVTKS
jgi:hypothetical protein